MEGVLIDDHRIHVDFSQSVSKFADIWRKEENNKRRSQGSRGGFGGVEDLERRRQYRDVGYERNRGDRYGMVFDKDEMGRRKLDADEREARPSRREKYRSHSRSLSPPPRSRKERGGYGGERNRSRDRSPPRRRRRSRTPERSARHRDRYGEDRDRRHQRGYHRDWRDRDMSRR
ncbi:Peptidyl-prolyl cis-trans isomerase cyp6 [Ascosphaera atra]|nr:Peptidyl-prolyl cis-trans isomerase cyp6 [Ascosphaera atra]